MQREGLIALSIVLTLAVLAGQPVTEPRGDATAISSESVPVKTAPTLTPTATRPLPVKCRSPGDGRLQDVHGVSHPHKQIRVSI